ncbi:MAG: hypothetical protein OYH76_00440 [Defluviicoccus sp.]|nr:hypothetical protein [Defluviicoccus sp.]MDE0274331.1 hypothetical protein [Defluviicoccus sp.]
MARHAGRVAGPGREPGKRAGSRSGGSASEGGAHVQGTLALPANLSRSLRHLDDADLDRLLEAATAEARRRGRLDGKTATGRAHGKPTPVTTGQEKLILAAFGAGLKPSAIAREFRLSRAQVEGVLKDAGQGGR